MNNKKLKKFKNKLNKIKVNYKNLILVIMNNRNIKRMN